MCNKSRNKKHNLQQSIENTKQRYFIYFGCEFPSEDCGIDNDVTHDGDCHVSAKEVETVNIIRKRTPKTRKAMFIGLGQSPKYAYFWWVTSRPLRRV